VNFSDRAVASARSTFCIFIASTTASVSPDLTSWPSVTAIATREAGHRAQHFAGIGRGRDRHQPRRRGPIGEDIDRDLKP
jgi:hypothetical protein